MVKGQHYKIGLVLSGGGFRGAAHIGAIKAMEEAGIYPEVISGVSAGALVGACYAAGLSTDRMLDLFMKPRIFSLSHYTYNKPGLLDTDKFITYLEEYIPQSDYDELKIPLYISATNMLTGKLVTFHSGELNKPILASCAFPFVFSPVWMHDSFYSDGGIINNFPVEPLVGKCQKIIGVYVNPVREIQPNELKNSLKVLERAFNISTGTIPYLKFKHCDFVVEPKELAGYNLFDRKNVMKMYEIGYDECKKMLDMIQNTDEYKLTAEVINDNNPSNIST